ncbi:MAG: AMP-binding protein, partial [bacterium]|nr:AMP-binding protein [bacterium]
AAGWDAADELRVLCGGEALPGALAAELTARSREVWNLYGPTETTVWSAVARVGEEVADQRRGEEATTPIGRAIANTRLHLLDRRLQPVAIGVPGELCIGGDGLARGYLGRPALTAEKFIPDPNAHRADGGSAGLRLYRTGDLARTLADGRLDFLGRLDHQVKLRGHRIELGEIEARLEGHPQVAQTAVVVVDERLVAYLVPAGESPPRVEELRGFLREEVPEYMVPSLFVPLESLPLTPNRKVDRRALPAPEAARPDLDTAYMPPTTELEKQLAAIWQEVLGVERVGLDDNFFDVGGHSLLLAQVRARVGKLTGREVPLMELFRRPNIRSLVAFLSGEEGPREAQRPAPAVVRGPRPGGEIAIVGMSARFAGAATVEEFWDNLCGGIESIRRLSVEELEAAGVDPEIYRAPDYVPACADLRDPDHFDAAFFGFNPREAEILDPQHRVLLECAWQALENAGCDPSRYPGRVGVFAGGGMSRYALNVFSNPELVRSLGMAPLMFAVGQDFLAPRISYKLNLTGPSMVVQTACSTSLVAVHLAQQALVGGTCDMALAGGVTLLEHPPQGYRFLEGGIQSSDGHCRAFDAAGEGMVSSSGAGVVVLKRLADALADGDRIHAVVKATAVNNDGAVKVGFTAPSEEGQAEVIREALQAAGVEPETIGYVEAHGTATALGDPIEVAALTRVFGKSAARRETCALGSVKTNIGHADTAAGVAGLIKATLAVDRGLVPPSLWFEQPNPAIDFAETPFYVPTELRKWQDGAGAPRRAGVSSFGIGGTNAHVIVEQAPATEPSGPSREWQLLVLSAATATALDAVTARLAEHLKAQTEKQPLADVAFTCQVGRRRLRHRRTLLCRGHEEAVASLAAP